MKRVVLVSVILMLLAACQQLEGEDLSAALCQGQCVSATTQAEAGFQPYRTYSRLAEICEIFNPQEILATGTQVQVVKITSESVYSSLALVIYTSPGGEVRTGLMDPADLDFGSQRAPHELMSLCGT